MSLKYLPPQYHKHILGQEPRTMDERSARIIEQRLSPFDLDKLEDKTEVVALTIPEGFGTINEELNEAYTKYDNRWARFMELVDGELPVVPQSFNCPSGWSVWGGSRWFLCEAPSAMTMIVDMETTNIGDDVWHPTCAVCTDGHDWYVWRADFADIYTTSVVPFEGHNTFVGYNVPYDRSFMSCEYLVEDQHNRFIDLMSMWIATNGMSNQQRTTFSSFKDDDADEGYDMSRPMWAKLTGTNGLASAYEFYTKLRLDKGVRDNIVDSGVSWSQDNMPEVIKYCIADVVATHELAKHLVPAYVTHRPSKVNRYGAIALGSCWVPLSAERFPSYYERVEAIYQSKKAKLNDMLMEACTKYLETSTCSSDNSHLDWSEAKTGKNKGLPKWYRDVLAAHRKGSLSLSQRFAPTVLNMTWLGKPLLWDADAKGWHTAEHGAIPHPTKRGQAVTSMFLKDFAHLYDTDAIGSSNDDTKAVVKEKASTINWVSSRKRVKGIHTESPEGIPVALPMMSVNGTITGRATDPIWMVLANPKANRIGTELKTMVEAFPGYKLVGADVDSQEAWLAGIHGDQDMGFCASTPFGAINAMGNSKTATDIHSLVAKSSSVTRDVAKVLNYGCVPMHSKALTRSGWKGYSELSIGEEILAYNSNTNCNEWSPIIDLAKYQDAPVVEVRNKHNYSHISTPNHRWYVKKRNGITQVVTTEELNTECNIITSAYSEGGNSTITPDEAAIIGWLITDGGVYWSYKFGGTANSYGTKRGVEASVFQKKESNVALLYSLLEPYLNGVSHRAKTGMYQFRLKPAFIRSLWLKAELEPDNEDYVKFVVNLTPKARRAFLEAFWLAEGHWVRDVRVISQNKGSELEAAVVAANMEGYMTRLSSKDGVGKCWSMRMMAKQHVTCQTVTKELLGETAVWCPKTTLGTWVMKQGDTITITGNTIYGAGMKGNADVLLKNDPSMSTGVAEGKAKAFIAYLKGKKNWDDGSYKEGLASHAFTRMETIADRRMPATPLTGAKMTNALAGIDDYKPTRVNWVVQASGVDFRDMLVILTNHFYAKLNVEGRLVITIHDEIRTMVREADIIKATYALQLAHLYVRTAFILAHKLDNIPAGAAWFSAVDIDTVLRKDPTATCETPTQTALAPGYTLTAKQLQELL